MPTYDIFISYGQLDDEDPAGDLKGWVDLLAERLPRLIASNLGYKPTLWRDDQSLNRYELLRQAIKDGASNSLLLVPVFSPRYVQSKWCQFELETFCGASSPGVPSHESRIFKVIKTPLVFAHLAEQEPEQLRDRLDYPFYEMDGNMPREFSPEVIPGKDQKYWNMLHRLAWDISTRLAALKHQSTTTQEEAPVAIQPHGASAPTKFIYLAETTSDLTNERAAVHDELRQRGYGVLPAQKLPLEERKKIEEAVRTDLGRSLLSVHLVGTRYGLTPEDDGRSVVRIQEELAAERAVTDENFIRLLWLPSGLMTPALPITDERQQSFVTELQNRLTNSVELLQTSVEDLKTLIVEKLSPPANAIASTDRRSKLKQIYLICENRDRGQVRPIKEYLFKQDFEVITWLEEGAAERLVEYHRKNLKECDAALVYFGNGDEPWVRKNLEDLEKAYGYGRQTDWLARAVYVGGPPNDQKEDFLTHLVPYVIRNFNSFDPNDLHDFVRKVQEAEGAAQ
jgi:hypothetical protein